MTTRTEKRRSEIWNFFSSKDAEKAECNICRKSYSYKTSLTNLKSHLKRKHPTINTQCVNIKINIDDGEEIINENKSQIIIHEQQPSSSTETTIQVINQAKTYQQNLSDSFHLPHKINIIDKKKIDNQLLELFTVDLQPFSIVDDKGFKKFVRLLNPSYMLPSRRTISSVLLPALYKEVYGGVQKLIKQASALTITIDCWTSINNDNYLAVTAYFITDIFEMKSVLLDCKVSNVSHTSEHLAVEIRNIITEWKIDAKILLSVSDNTAVIENALINELNLKHFCCFAYTLNLIASKSLKLIKELLERVNIVATYYQANAKSIDKQKQTLEERKQLGQDEPTCWNSIYYMLQRFIELEEVFRTSQALIDKDLPLITPQEWKLVKEIAKILQPMEDAIKVISEEEYLSGSLVIVVANGLKNIYKEFNETTDFSDSAKTVLHEITIGIHTRFSNLERNSALIMATFLDPRFKNFAFSNENTSEIVKDLVINLVASKIEPLVSRNLADDTVASGNISLASQEEKSLIFKKFDQDINCKIMHLKVSVQSRAIIEVQRYLDEPPLPRTENPLIWWAKQVSLPQLTQVAKEKLSVVGISAHCERVFKKSGLILNDARCSPTPETLKQILFLNANHKH